MGPTLRPGNFIVEIQAEGGLRSGLIISHVAYFQADDRAYEVLVLCEQRVCSWLVWHRDYRVTWRDYEVSCT